MVFKKKGGNVNRLRRSSIRHAPRGCSRGGDGSWGCTRGVHYIKVLV